MGLVGGIATGGALMLGGWFLGQGGEPGIAILVGLLFFAGAIIVVVTLFGWLFGTVYGRISPKNRWVVWSIIPLLVVGYISKQMVNVFLESRPAAISTRAAEQQARFEARAIQDAADEKDAVEQLQSWRKLLVGKWVWEEFPNNILEYDQTGSVSVIYLDEHGNESRRVFTWKLERLEGYGDDVFLIHERANSNRGDRYKFLYMDAEKLEIVLPWQLDKIKRYIRVDAASSAN